MPPTAKRPALIRSASRAAHARRRSDEPTMAVPAIDGAAAATGRQWSTARILTLTALATVVVLVLSTVAVFGALRKDVTIDVNGTTTRVSSYADTVGDVLAEQGVAVGSHDQVAPAVDQPIPDHGDVVVRSAKQVSAEVDGQPATVWTTARSADAAVADLADRNAQLVASRSAAGGREAMDLTVKPADNVTVTVDGATTTAPAQADTVDGLLSQRGVSLGDRDKVAVTHTGDTLNVAVTRVSTSTRDETREVPYQQVQQDDDSMYVGTTKVVQQGQPGVYTTSYATTLENGAEVRRAIVNQGETQAPVTEIVHVGTKAKPKPTTTPSTSPDTGGSTPPPTNGSSSGLNWAALAQCESGGNPQAVSKSGSYYGLYQFSLSTWKSVGGSGLPTDASAAEQTQRAQALYERSGAGQWPVCGKRLFN